MIGILVLIGVGLVRRRGSIGGEVWIGRGFQVCVFSVLICGIWFWGCDFLVSCWGVSVYFWNLLFFGFFDSYVMENFLVVVVEFRYC